MRNRGGSGFGVRPDHVLAVVGVVALVVAAVARPGDTQSAASQDWSPFVLVTGLLLIGLVADDDGLFAAVGQRMARTAPNGTVLFLGASVLIGVVTAVLNLDTSVAFLTPVLVYTARSRGDSDAALLYGCLLLSNAGSLFLPGSNLTNLIVLGHRHLSGGAFLARMWAPALAALVVTAVVIAVFEHRSFGGGAAAHKRPERPVLGLGALAVGIAVVLVVVLSSPALPVVVVGGVAVGTRIIRRQEELPHVAQVLGVPVLVGLFGVAVGLGTLGRTWSGPATLLSHLGSWGTAFFAAVTSVVVNNLPAASLLASRAPEHPFSLLIGLNLGPNLFVTGSLAWLLWLRTARSAGADPSIARASRIGVVAVPLSMAAALGLLALSGSS
ncbi:MAG: SLC13 family permease [Acidimicrobiales bacterium]|jgi:arsenical pump membrane protein